MLIYTASCEASAAVSSGSGATTEHNVAIRMAVMRARVRNCAKRVDFRVI